MKTQFNSSAVRNEVANMQETPVKTANKTALFYTLVWVVSAVVALVVLNSFGLIPA